MLLLKMFTKTSSICKMCFTKESLGIVSLHPSNSSNMVKSWLVSSMYSDVKMLLHEVNFVGLEGLVADIRTLEYISNSYALGKG